MRKSWMNPQPGDTPFQAGLRKFCKRKGHELDDCWKQIQMHREEIVYALYEANKRALEDHEKDKSKKRKKK